MGSKRINKSTKSRSKRAIVLYSGGIDSAVLLKLASLQGFDVLALTFDYGQKNREEIRLAEENASKFGAKEYQLLDISKALKGFPKEYIPGRNLMFLSIAATIAEAERRPNIFFGAIQALDVRGGTYLDVSQDFIESAQIAITSGTEYPIEIFSPLAHTGKDGVIRLAEKLGLQPNETSSCSFPDAQGKACGLCRSCEELTVGRKLANRTKQHDA